MPKRFPVMVALVCLSLPVEGAERPNYVFFLVDDLGWADVGHNGSTFYETPHIDALARSGTRFTNGYAAASVCSPTRASILTGRHPARVGITDWIPGSRATGRFQGVEDRAELGLDEVTIAELLKSHGYRTFFAGKWHLGGKGFHPEDQGFDVNIGGNHRGGPAGGYYAPWQNDQLGEGQPGEYLTERLTAESLRFIDSQRNRDEPFLLYLSYYNVHTPIQAYRKRIAHFREKASALGGETPVLEEMHANSRGRQDNAELASMVAAVDASVGSILKRLRDTDLDGETVVIFFSDNGGLCTRPDTRRARDGGVLVGPGCNLPLRAGKGWLFEGGIRVPAIIRAPRVGQPGTVCHTPVVSMDFFPTILELAGLPLQPELHRDGRSLVPLLKAPEAPGAPRALFWHYPHYHGSGWKPGGAIRHGKYKLIEFWEYDRVQLYDLSEDPGEQHDLGREHPDLVRALRAKLATWRGEIGAVMPEPAAAGGDR